MQPPFTPNKTREKQPTLRARLQSLWLPLRTFLWAHVVWSVIGFMLVVWTIAACLVFAFEKGAPGANITSLSDSFWWGIVTFLTVGYGDRYPVTFPGRSVAALLMLSGVACVGIITAKISSLFLEKALRDGRGIVDTDKLKNHFVICGWNGDMYELLMHILDFNTQLTAKDVVVVGQMPQSQIDAFRADARFRDLSIIVGDHFTEMSLKRAAPERAKKILILADRSPGPGGQMPTPTEIDARTIMTAMTLSHLARGTLVAAEILDPKMDHYLKLASVSEIIYSSEYSRLLLGNATSGTGIANIIFDLLDNNATSHITSAAIPAALVGQSYAELVSAFAKHHDTWLVIGLLENSGNSHTIRERALRRAQQTPDIVQLVANLKSVKEIRCNQPLFHPASDHLITESTMAIVIARRETQRGARVGSEKAQRSAA